MVIYSSLPSFADQECDAENSVELCRSYISANFDGDAAKQAFVIEDNGHSEDRLERPGFCAMMNLAKSGAIQAIVIPRIHSISSDIGDFLTICMELSNLGIRLVSVTECFDSETVMGRSILMFMSVFAAVEKESVRE